MKIRMERRSDKMVMMMIIIILVEMDRKYGFYIFLKFWNFWDWGSIGDIMNILWWVVYFYIFVFIFIFLYFCSVWNVLLLPGQQKCIRFLCPSVFCVRWVCSMEPSLRPGQQNLYTDLIVSRCLCQIIYTSIPLNHHPLWVS